MFGLWGLMKILRTFLFNDSLLHIVLLVVWSAVPAKARMGVPKYVKRMIIIRTLSNITVTMKQMEYMYKWTVEIFLEWFKSSQVNSYLNSHRIIINTN